ncbi:hypothetical protein C8R41DRAFT_869533 [Lentinula lateritia]|uniref:Uncharacterized protein n=1 Tax=Lentinula lateritia TaxID=40482 RepID=A0ABQ8V7E5_9AGAR|nr:hypothetical protein C8R41DRAFT_869533 [Lentinula lateritia]
MYTCKHVLSNVEWMSLQEYHQVYSVYSAIDMKFIPWRGYYMYIDQGTWSLTCEESIKQLHRKTAMECGSDFAETVTAKFLCLNLHGFACNLCGSAPDLHGSAYCMELHEVARNCAELCGTAWDWCRGGYGKSSVPMRHANFLKNEVFEESKQAYDSH